MKILVACVLWTVLVLIMSSQGSLFEKKDKKVDNTNGKDKDGNVIPFTLLGTDLNEINDISDMRKPV